MTRFTITLTPARQRALALGLALAVCVAALSGLYSWAAAQWEHHERIALLARQLSARRALVKELPQWAEDLSRIQGSLAWQNRLIAAPVDGEPGPLQRLVLQFGGVPGRSTVVQRETGSAVELDETVRFTADIKALTHILYALRSSGPLFVIRQLGVTTTESIGSALRTTSNKLQVEMTVAGYVAPK